jgi:HPt (histidine-containing phosphotransfer) domain-containing protein
MNTPSPTTSPKPAVPIDVDALLRRCLGSAKVVCMILERFERQAGEDFAGMADLVRRGDLAGASQIAHALKGAAGMVAAESLAKAVGRIEGPTRIEGSDSAEALLDSVKRELDACIGYVPTAKHAVANATPRNPIRIV